MTAGGFQTQVNVQPAPAVEGDFCSMNPRKSVLAGPGGLVSGVLGAFVGRACWVVDPDDGDGAPATVNSFGTGNITGIVHREQQADIVLYLADSSMLIKPGTQMTVMSDADFWVKNTGSGQAQPGMKAYANFADGKFTFAAASSPTAGGTSTASTITPTTFSVTGSITDDVLTVTVVGSGTVVPGATISGTNVASGTQVVSQLSGTPGGVGTYAVSIAEQTVASETISGTYGLLTVGGTVAGTFGVGDTLAATGSVVADTAITALGTGTGGAGTYVVNNNTNVGSQAINVNQVNIETKYFCRSTGNTGELVKISPTPLQ